MEKKIRIILERARDGVEPLEDLEQELFNLHSVSKRALLTESQAKKSCRLCNGKGHLHMKMEDGLYYVIDCPKCIAEI